MKIAAAQCPTIVWIACSILLGAPTAFSIVILRLYAQPGNADAWLILGLSALPHVSGALFLLRGYQFACWIWGISVVLSIATRARFLITLFQQRELELLTLTASVLVLKGVAVALLFLPTSTAFFAKPPQRNQWRDPLFVGLLAIWSLVVVSMYDLPRMTAVEDGSGQTGDRGNPLPYVGIWLAPVVLVLAIRLWPRRVSAIEERSS